MACRGFLQCLLKLFNLALALVGVLLLVFSISLLVKEQPPQPPAPSPSSPLPSLLSATRASRLSSSTPLLTSSPVHASGESSGKRSHGEREITPRFSSRTLLLDPAHRSRVAGDGSLRANSAASQARVRLTAPKLPNLWFTYLLIGVGAYITLLTLMGAIAAESNIVCCMTSYQFGLCFLLLCQLVAAALVWMDEVPPDPTGEYDRRRKFVEDNLELCKLAALCLLIVEGTALLLAMMLRAIQVDEAAVDDDEDYLMVPRSHLLQQQQQHQQQRRLSYAQQPLMGTGQGGAQQPSQLMGTASGANMGSTTGLLPTGSGTPHTDTWRGRLMEKYGMDPNEFQYGAVEARGSGGGGGMGAPLRSTSAVASSGPLPSAAQGPGQEPQAQGSGSRCTVM